MQVADTFRAGFVSKVAVDEERDGAAGGRVYGKALLEKLPLWDAQTGFGVTWGCPRPSRLSGRAEAAKLPKHGMHYSTDWHGVCFVYGS